MKCVKHVTDKRVDRVSDEDAARLVAQKWWVYCPKHEYKSQQLKREETGDADAS